MKFKIFVVPVYPYGNDHYYHEMVAIAEGLKALGHQVIGNCNYWKESKSDTYLIPDANDDTSFDVAIYDYRYVRSFEHLLFRMGYPNFDRAKKHILIDRNDWISPIWDGNEHYRIFDFILGCHTVSRCKHPPNYRAWAMGLTNRMITAIDENRGEVTDNGIGHNFRVWHNLRKEFVNDFSTLDFQFELKEKFTEPPIEEDPDYTYYKATTRRHSQEYFKIINESLMFLGFGGYVEYEPKLYQPYSFTDKLRRKYRKFLSAKNRKDNCFVFQWDSFRMWELFYANACPILLNFESFNFQLPELPVDGEHYIGIDDFQLSGLKTKLDSLSADQIQAIGQSGRQWVSEHYSPSKTADRFLQLIQSK